MERRGGVRKIRSRAEKRAIVERFESSGMSQGDFCEAEGIAKSSLYNWRRAKSGVGTGGGMGSFVEVVGAGKEMSRACGGAIELELPHGIVLRIRN